MQQLHYTQHETPRTRSWTHYLSNYCSIALPSSSFHKKNMKRTNMKYIVASIALFALIVSASIYTTLEVHTKSLSTNIHLLHHTTYRNLLSSEEECFSKAADPKWLALFCFLGTLYMFIALSIVCDEFFVPSLQTITLQLGISNDVAGATLMAAGGSAPELFTSLIGTFQETDVGFAAIVGSAVFNVLFVIGICALSSPKPLELTWWPLARDCVYYAFGLAVLSIFFIPISKQKIEWFESLTLFILYIGYVVFMKYNQDIYEMIMQCKNRGWKYKEKTKIVRSSTKHALDEFHVHIDERKLKSVFVSEDSLTTFRAGMFNILLADEWEWNDVISIAVVNSICGDVHQTFQELDTNGDDYLDIDELGKLLDGLNADRSQNTIQKLMKELDTNDDARLSFKEFSVWYIRSEERILGSMNYIFNEFDANQNGALSISEIRAFLNVLGVKDISHKGVEDIFAKSGIDAIDGMSFTQFKQWFIDTEYYKRKLSCFAQQASCIENVDNVLVFPESYWSRFWFILSVPLIILFIYTIPDTRKPGKARYCYLSFIISILWIGVFSYFLVSWTSIVGDTLKIPLVVMGLTFLAAGTSIPDLLSSVIVAKQGKGDMAVSSSVGSNIFDILVGLPVPWLLYSLVYGGKPVTVNADGLEISILILLGMLVTIVVIIKLANWKMTKQLGIAMIILYVVFVAQDLARANWFC